MTAWTLTSFDHCGRPVSRLETASGLVLVPGRDRLDVHLAPIGQARLACVREGSLSIGDVEIEAVRGLHESLVFAAWSTNDRVSIAGAAWPTTRAMRDVLAHLVSLLASSRVTGRNAASEQLVEAASQLLRRVPD